jgi:putative ABC transport system permease protein
MKHGRNLRLSLSILGAHRLRTSLTILGVLVGVAVLVVVVSIGDGMSREITAKFQAMGTDLLVVRAGQVRVWGGRPRQMTSVTTLTLKDAEAIRRLSDHVVAVVPSISRRLPLRSATGATQTNVEAMSHAGFRIRDFQAAQGRLFGPDEEGARQAVAVLGATTAKNLFGPSNPVGQRITLGRLTFKVIGVTAPKGSDSWGDDMDDIVFIPLDTGMKRLFHVVYVETLFVQSFGEAYLAEAEVSITELLRERHKTTSTKDDDFTVQNQLSLLEASVSTLRSTNRVVIGVAGMSLLVAGIGILAVMLMTVRERRWEIGLRRALGARRRDIAQQFLTEAALLTFFGGILGVVISALVVHACNAFGWATADYSWVSAGIGGVVAIAVGVVFGLYPAIKASRLQPVEALNSPA